MSGRRLTSASPIPFRTFWPYWDRNSKNLPVTGPNALPPVIGALPRTNYRNLNDRLFEHMGSTNNVSPFRLLYGDLNVRKGIAFSTMYDEDTNRRIGIKQIYADEEMRRRRIHLIQDGRTLNDSPQLIQALRTAMQVWYVYPDLLISGLNRKCSKRQIGASYLPKVPETFQYMYQAFPTLSASLPELFSLKQNTILTIDSTLR